MPADDLQRERRTLLGVAALAVLLIIVGIVSAMILTAGEPRRGEGMIPPPTDESVEEQEPAPDGGPDGGADGDPEGGPEGGPDGGADGGPEA